MRKTSTAVLGALGMGILVGGIMGMIGGIFQREVRVLSGLGPLNGTWDADQVKFVGGILASIGSAMFTFALLLRRSG
jgi:hypothetical protein